MNKKVVILVVIPGLVLVLFAVAWACGYRVNVTSSLPLGLYRLTDERPQRGSIVFFCLESEHFIKLARAREYAGTGTCPGALRALGKEVYGLPGDLVSIGADGSISINHQTIPGSAARDVDSKGRPMPKPALTAGNIPVGQALTLSLHHQGSFDGRYFGLVSLSNLRQARPVLTFKKRGQHGSRQGVSGCGSRGSIPATGGKPRNEHSG